MTPLYRLFALRPLETCSAGLDQGALAPRHSHVASDFIEDKFTRGGVFALDKAEAFLSYLKKNRDHLASDARETAISEWIQRDVQTHASALKEATKKGTHSGNNALSGYDAYVLPKAEAITAKIRAHHPPDEVRAEIEDFLRGYAPYYAPDTVSTPFTFNNQLVKLCWHVVVPHRIKKDDPCALEASNLVVEGANQREISALLQKEVAVGHYLAPSEIDQLKRGGFDISNIHPGVSAYLARTTPADVDRVRASRAHEFPGPDERSIYKEPRYRSSYSTKFTAEFERDGVTYKLKVKLGQEVHSHLISFRIREYLGFHQDQAQHRDEVTIYLKNKTYEQFERDLAVMYGISQLRQCIVRRGVDQRTGEEWVVFKDVMLESRPKHEIRVSTIDPGVYDGKNRRELRARILVNAFLGTGDTMVRNNRMVLCEKEDGQYLPEWRFHDTGISLGRRMVFHSPRDLLNLPGTRNKIEEYDRDYIKCDNDGDVTLVYNDWFNHNRDFEDTTYADLKWMARVITSLPDECLTKSIAESGLPGDLVSIYHFHIARMRNRLVDAFRLDRCYENIPGASPLISKIPLPPRSSINEEGAVVNGKIVRKSYPGKIIYPQLQETWFTFLNSLLSFAAAAEYRRNIEHRLQGMYAVSAGPIASATVTVGVDVLGDQVPASVGDFALTPGISVHVGRVVTPNENLFSAEGQGRPYVVRDRVSFSIGVGASFASDIVSAISAAAAGRLHVLRKSYEHIHYAESVSKGYLSKPRIIDAIFGDMEKFALSSLNPGEVVRDGWEIGLNASVGAQVATAVPGIGFSVLSNSASSKLEWMRSSDVAYAKDPLGALHLLVEKDLESAAAFGVRAGFINLIEIRGSLLEAHAGASRITQNYWNIQVVPPQYDLEMAHDALNQLDRERLAIELKLLRHEPELVLRRDPGVPLSQEIQLRYHLDAEKTEKVRRGAVAYIFNADRTRSETRFSADTKDYSYDFYRVSAETRDLNGFEEVFCDAATRNVLVREGTAKRLTVELDRASPRSFVGMLDVYDYHRAMKQSELVEFIGALNSRYSRSASEPFFRTDLPETTKRYNKVYANARIYINGDKLLGVLDDLGQSELERRIRLAFRSIDTKIGGHGEEPSNLADKIDRKRLCHKALEASRSLTRAAEELSALTVREGRHEVADSAVSPERRAAEEELANAAYSFVYALYKNKYGVQPLLTLLGEECLLMIGEIFGVHQRTNSLQEDSWTSSIRFMGKSWGKLSKVAPVSHYVRHDQTTPANAFALPVVPIEGFVGTNVTGLAGNFVGLGRR